MADSPTTRTLKALREAGYLAEVVERWNPHAKIRQDLYGFIDILAVRDDEVLGVQATSTPNLSARVDKIVNHKNLAPVLAANVRVQAWGWKKYKKPEQGKYWRPTIREILS